MRAEIDLAENVVPRYSSPSLILGAVASAATMRKHHLRLRHSAVLMLYKPWKTYTPLFLVLLALASSTGCKLASSGHNIEGTRLYEQGQYSAAQAKFQAAIENDPENADSYYNMASTFHRMGIERNDKDMLQQAEMLYNQCLDKNEDHVDCHRALAVLLVETGRTASAETLLKRWAQTYPNSAEPRLELARFYYEFGDRPTAKQHLDQALQLEPANPRAWNVAGMFQEESGNYSQALANYMQSYQQNNLQPGVANRMASLQRTIMTSGGNTTTNSGTTLATPVLPPTRY